MQTLERMGRMEQDLLIARRFAGHESDEDGEDQLIPFIHRLPAQTLPWIIPAVGAGSVTLNERRQAMTYYHTPTISSTVLRRPYSYDASHALRGSGYPQMYADLQVLMTILKSTSTGLKSLIDVLAPRSPSEIDSLRHAFRAVTGNDLAVAVSNFFRANGFKDSVKSAFVGLVLGPLLYDLCLLQKVHTLSALVN